MWLGGLLLVLVIYWIVMLIIAVVHFLFAHWWIAVLAVATCWSLYIIAGTWQRRAYRKSRLRAMAADHAGDLQRLRHAYEQANRDIDHVLREWR